MSDDAFPTPPPRAAEPRHADYDARRAARRLLRTARSAALATLTPEGTPYASLVTLATLPDGRPVMPLSTLAVHTRHLLADPRCSLLLDGAGTGDPLAHPRLTLTGRARQAGPAEHDAWRERFLRRHPGAGYVDFGDFSLWRLDLGEARMIGGFGRIDGLRAADLLTETAGAEALIAAEGRAVDHMNADHRDALRLYATALCGAPDGDWRVSGLDPDGIDLGRDDATLRLDFPTRVADPGALRRQLVRWAEEARAVPGEFDGAR